MAPTVTVPSVSFPFSSLMQEEKDRKTKEFLDTLPKESLTLDEKNLWDAIQNFLKKWSEEHGRQVLATTNDLGKCSVVQDAS